MVTLGWGDWAAGSYMETILLAGVEVDVDVDAGVGFGGGGLVGARGGAVELAVGVARRLMTKILRVRPEAMAFCLARRQTLSGTSLTCTVFVAVGDGIVRWLVRRQGWPFARVFIIHILKGWLAARACWRACCQIGTGTPLMLIFRSCCS